MTIPAGRYLGRRVGHASGRPVYAVEGAAGLIPNPPALDVKQINPLLDFPDTTVIEFNHATGFSVSSGGAGVVIIDMAQVSIDVQEVSGSGAVVLDSPNTTILQFDDGSGLTMTIPVAGTSKVKQYLLDVQQTNPALDFPLTKILRFDHGSGLIVSGGAGVVDVAQTLLDVWEESSGAPVVDVPNCVNLQFHRADGFRVTSPAAGLARVGFVPTPPTITYPGATAGIVATNSQYTVTTTLAPVTGLGVSLPDVGTYIVTGCVYAYCGAAGGTGQFFTIQLYDSTNATIFITPTIADYLSGPGPCNATVQWIVTTVAINTAVIVRAQCTIPTGVIRPNSTLSYVRIN